MRVVDTLIKNGEIVLPQGVMRASLTITDGRISGILSTSAAEPTADEVIDASGLTVIPGLVDMHSHHREPGFEYKEDIASVTRACAAGGVTTTVAMPNVAPPPNTYDRLVEMKKLYDASAIVDWNINPAGTVIEEFDRLATSGVAAFKVFMVTDTKRDYPHMPGIGVHNHGELLAIMEACAARGVPLMVHPHDQELMDQIESEFWDRDERDALAYARAYAAKDGLIWETAIGTLIRMQQATGVHLHLLHVQTKGSIDLIRAAKARGQKVTAEVNPWALFLGNDWSNIERLGSYALSYWVPETNSESLWEAMVDGTIDIVATDHAPHTREEKEIGWEDGWAAHTGTPSTQFYLRMLLDAVSRGRLTLERMVELSSTAPARAFGLEGKGVIQVDADADLVFVDRDRESTITDEEVLSKVGWTPYKGMVFRGLPVATYLRGRAVFKDGKVIGEPGFARQAVAKRTQLTAEGT